MCVRGIKPQGAKSPLLTIVIPFYNTRLDLVGRCLRQINMLPENEIEVVIIDDGSEPAIVAGLRELTQNCSTSVSVYSKKNGGQNSARQLGIEFANGEYLLFHDADDFIEVAATMDALEYLKSNTPDVLAFGYDEVDCDGRTLKEVVPWQPGFNVVSKAKILMESDSLCRQFYRTETIRSLSFGLTQGIRIGEDLSSAISYALALSDFRSFGGILYHYVRYQGSATGSVTSDRLDDIRAAFDIVFSRFDVASDVNYSEIEWMAILHVLMWGNRRIIEVVGPSKEKKIDVYAWMNDRFPKWKSNLYIDQALKDGGIRYRLLIMGRWKTFYLIQKVYKIALRVLEAVRSSR